MKTIAFFNNKGGVGKTSLVYHLAWMFSEMNLKVIAVDLDPQANLTSMLLDEKKLEELWPDGEHTNTILGAITPILEGTGDIKQPHVEEIKENSFGLLVGDLGLSLFEDKLSRMWPECHDRSEAAFRTISAFYRIAKLAAEQRDADLVLIDVGPNLGAINRSALLCADYVVIPLTPDLFSLQGLKNLGPSLRTWRTEWQERVIKNKNERLFLPSGKMEPLGYVAIQHAMRTDKPVKAYQRWMNQMPNVYRKHVLEEAIEEVSVEHDPLCLAMLKHYRSLMPLAMEARKPMFHLKPADGAIGAHVAAVQDCYKDFEMLAGKILQKI